MKKGISLFLTVVMIISIITSLMLPVSATQSRVENFNKNYSLTGNQAYDIASVAEAQIGRTGASYGYTEHWCADFVSDCARSAGVSTSVIPYTGGVLNMYNAMLSNGGYKVTTPQRGDLAFYWNGSNWCHVALMIDSVNSIHGNVNGQSGNFINTSYVTKCKYSAYNGGTATFIRPNYGGASSTKPSVSIDKPVTPVVTDTTFSFNTPGALSLHLYIYYGTEKYFEGEFSPSQTYTRQFYHTGHYSCYIIAHYSWGDIESNWLGFDVIDKTYTITFDANGGSGAPSPQTKIHGQTLTLSSTKPIRSGYTFLGWSTSSTATKATCSAGGSFTANADTTLYAVWQKNHSHSYTSQITKAPTCTETGIRKYTCSCGASYTQTIAATGHTSSGLIISWYPSADSDGYGYRECEVCYDVLDEQYYDQYECDAPYLYEIVNTAKGVKIEWEDVYGADNYFVYRKTYNATTKKWGGWSRLADNVTSTSYTDKTAKTGTYYRYTVRAENEAGLSGYDSSGLKIKFLATPKLTSIANNTGKVTVKWNKVSGATGYIVYRKTYNASTKTWSGWSRLATTKSSSYNDTKAKSGTYYRYTVRAYYGDYVSYFDTTGLKTKYLATPPLKSVASAKSGVTVKWGKVTGATGYIVYRKTGNGSWKQMAVVKGNTKVSYLDKTAKKGTTYKYTVRAYYGSYRSYFNTKGLTIKDKY